MLNKYVAVLATCFFSTVSIAQTAPQLTGTWKLVSFYTELQSTGERRLVYGKDPVGYFIFTPEGRATALIVGEARKPGESDQERAALHRTMFAYSGTYRVEGDKLTTKVDISWNQTWTGTEQVRYFKIDGNRMDIMSAWSPAPNLPGNPITRGVLSWERSN